MQGTAVCQKIIDDQHLVLGVQKLFRNDHLIFALVGERFHLCHVDRTVNVDALGFLGEHHRHVETACHDTGDTGSLNGQDLVDLLVCKAAFELLPHLLEQGHVHLVIQKAVHFQNVAFLDDTVLYDSFL